jgi:hypothetical protein
MRRRSSGGYDANDVVPHHVGNEQHSAIDNANGVETKFAGAADIVELDHIRVQEHFRRGSEADPMLLPVGFFRLASSGWLLPVGFFRLASSGWLLPWPYPTRSPLPDPAFNLLIFSIFGKAATGMPWANRRISLRSIPLQIRSPSAVAARGKTAGFVGQLEKALMPPARLRRGLRMHAFRASPAPCGRDSPRAVDPSRRFRSCLRLRRGTVRPQTKPKNRSQHRGPRHSAEMGCDHGRCLARRPELFQQIDSLGRPRRIMHRANSNARPRLARRLWLEGGLRTPDCVTVCDY